MPFSVLARPFVNVSDASEQKVLALIRHLAPCIADWRKGAELREQLAKAEAQVAPMTARQREMRAKVVSLNTDIAHVWKARLPASLMAGGLLLAMGLAFFKQWFVASLALGMTGYGFYMLTRNKSALTAEKTKAESGLAETSTQLTSTHAKIVKLKGELEARAASFPTVTLAKVVFGLERREILGLPAVIDRSGVWPSQTLKTIDLSAMGEGVKCIKKEVEALKGAPVLLSADNASGEEDAMENLYGEEARLQTIVEDYVATLSRVSDVTVSLPLLPATEKLAAALAGGESQETVQNPRGLLVLSNEEDASQLQRFVQFVNENRENAQATLRDLKESYDALANACDFYSQARVYSLNYLHQEILDTLGRSAWCSKNFYCPRTIKTPEYLYGLLELDFETAHELDMDELEERLVRDEVIRKRLEDQPDILTNMAATWRHIHDPEPTNVDKAEFRYRADERQKSLIAFRRMLSRAITGSPSPMLAISEQARLFYNPETEAWSSPLVPHEYRTHDVERYGQMLKATTDLMYPMWTHLWTEKADFRKSEQFRSNELLIQMSEKESEKLIEIGNQFRADMRSVRENLYVVEAEIGSKVDEIRTFCEGMQSMGLLSARQRKISDEQLAIVTNDQSVLGKASERESALAIMPQIQAELRGTVSDPIDMIRDPMLLIARAHKDVSSVLTMSQAV